jgi:hypothetical protein
MNDIELMVLTLRLRGRIGMMPQAKQIYCYEVRNDDDKHLFFAHCRRFGELAHDNGCLMIISRETEIGWIDTVVKSIPQLERLRRVSPPAHYKVIFRK